jgi:hypothetical protein
MGPTKSNRREIPPRLSQSYFRRTRIGGLTQLVTVHVLKVGKLARLTAFRTTSRFHTACSAALFCCPYDSDVALRRNCEFSRSGYRAILANRYGVANMSEQRSSEWLSIETMRPPSETEVWLYAKIDGAEITKKGRISKTNPGEPTVYQQWDDTRGPPTHWKPTLDTR